LDNENNLTRTPKENMLVIIIHKNPHGEKSMMKHITSLKTLDEKTLKRQNSYKEKSVI
jgi:hypothetical protein